MTGIAGSAGGGTTGRGGQAGTTAVAAAPLERRARVGSAGATAGRGGTTGAAGSAGTTGQGGSAGAGRGGTTGTAGQGGSAGATAGRGGTTGAAGSAGTTGQGGQGNLPGGVTSLFPPPNGQNLCPDPPLKITFSGTPTLGSSGRFRVFNSGGSAVATVDMAAATVTETIGGMAFTVSRPVYVDGNTVFVTLPPKALAYGMTYYVTVESGAIAAGGGAFSITDTNTWRFTTDGRGAQQPRRAQRRARRLGQLLLRAGRVRSRSRPTTPPPSRVTVGTGSYHEIIYLNAKSNVTLQGQDRNGTVISGTNNNNLQPEHARPRAVRRRQRQQPRHPQPDHPAT